VIASRLPPALPLVVAGVALALVPALKLPAFYETFLYLVLFWVSLATSWNILSGYAGYFSFGHAAFFGAGVYTTAMLAATWNWPFLWTLPVAGLVATILGLGVGAVVFRVRRLRGELFALLTLAAGCTDSNQGGMGSNPSRERTPAASPPTSPAPAASPSDSSPSSAPSGSPSSPAPGSSEVPRTPSR